MKKLKAAGIRCELDDRNEKIGYKIREAQLDKIPYMFYDVVEEIDTVFNENVPWGCCGGCL